MIRLRCAAPKLFHISEGDEMSETFPTPMRRADEVKFCALGHKLINGIPICCEQ